MKYIKTVILENFQSHKNSVIEFNNQLNVIVGPSDSGKTAILRGIKWALYNEPSGDYFIKEGESYCSVTIIFSDSTRIKRYRSKSKNAYYLYDANNNETKFEGFGTSVPEEIINITGIQKILLDQDHSSAINLSDQLDGAFLLSERGAIRANSIGRLVGVNIIDDSLRETLKDVRNLSGDKRHINQQVVELEDELIEYEYLGDLQDRIDNLEIIRNKIYEKQQLEIKYKDLLSNFKILVKEKELVNTYIDQLQNIHILDNIIKDILVILSKYKDLNRKNNKLISLYKDKQVNSDLIYSLKDIKLGEDILENIRSKSNAKAQISILKTELTNNSKEIHQITNLLNKLNKLDKLQIVIDDIDEKNKQLNRIEAFNNNIASLSNRLSIGKDYLSKLDYTDKIFEIVDKLDKKIILFHKLHSLLIKYKAIREELGRDKEYLSQLKNSFQIDLDKYKTLLLNQETCPFCFSNIDNNRIQHIISTMTRRDIYGL